jgi:hypothetical protein
LDPLRRGLLALERRPRCSETPHRKIELQRGQYNWKCNAIAVLFVGLKQRGKGELQTGEVQDTKEMERIASRTRVALWREDWSGWVLVGAGM